MITKPSLKVHEEMLTKDQLAELMNCSRGHIDNLMKDPTFPRLRIGPQSVRFLYSEVQAFFRNRNGAPTTRQRIDLPGLNT